MSDLYDHVRALMESNLKVPVESIVADTPFEDLSLDSLALLELSVVLESEFGIQIEDDDIPVTSTLESTVSMLQAKGVTT